MLQHASFFVGCQDSGAFKHARNITPSETAAKATNAIHSTQIAPGDSKDVSISPREGLSTTQQRPPHNITPRQRLRTSTPYALLMEYELASRCVFDSL